MRKFGKTISIIIFAAVLHLLAGAAVAEVFLKGNYIEVGVHNSGSFGTSTPAPAGFHPFAMLGGKLGFVADPAKDGWSVGAPPATGDYFVTGVPEEGWSVQWSGGGTNYLFHNYGLMGQFQVPVTSISETSSGDSKSALWVGTATGGGGTLKITQNASFNVNDLFFTMNVVFTNTGSTTLSALKYMRNVDPDQESGVYSGGIYGTPTTRNWVAAQPPRSGGSGKASLPARPEGNTSKALVLSRGLNWGFTLGLGAIDSRAVVATQGFSNRNIDTILNTPSQPTAAAPITNDQAIVLLYDLGDLAPGQSKSVTYAYILAESDLERALGNLAAITILQPTGTVSGSAVLFQATTDKVSETTKMDFYVNGTQVGTDSTPNAGGVFEATFDSTLLPNGTVTLKVVGTFTNGTTVEKTSIVTVDNAGPPVSFMTPLPEAVFSGTGIPVQISIDPAHQPARVSFFRESGGTSLFLGEDTSAPFTAAFDVTDLSEGATVVIKAVATDSLGRATTIAVSGTSYRNAPPRANPGIFTNVECSGSLTGVTLDGAGSTDPDGDPLTYSWTGPFGTVTGSPVVVSLPRGAHTISLTVSDGKATDTASATVTIADTVPPTVSAGTSVTLEATGPNGAPYLVPATAADACGLDNIAIVPLPALFPIGTTAVTVTALDLAGHSTSATVNVTVVDTTAPVVTPPANVTVEATGPGTSVPIGAATAVDIVGVVTLTNSAPATFPVGTTVVVWTATDAAGNKGTATQTVTVKDTTAPTLAGLASQIVEATSASGAMVTFTVTASDLVTAHPAVTCIPASGSTFALGTTTVTCKATDDSGNSVSGSFPVKVQDTTAPALHVPAGIRVPLNTPASAPAIQAFLAAASATDKVDANVTISYTLPALTTVGPKTVTFTATDDFGNSTTASATIWVEYGFAGFLAPVSLGKPFKPGSTVPVKFQLTDASSSVVTSATAKLQVQKYSNNEPVGDAIEVTSTSAADVGNLFRVSDGIYIYNLDTRALGTGTYQIQALLDDGTTKTTWLSLTK